MKPFLQPQTPTKRKILTVSELNAQSKSILESSVGSIWLTGEISNLTKASSGHWYFSLKDKSAQIRCAMFRFKTQTLKFSPNEGDEVVVKGKVSLYEARGDYQLIADYMEPAGLGNLQQKLNELMAKLQEQGLFDASHKKELPTMPKRIGVVTSPTGAAIHDVLSVLQRRCPMVPVIIYPTQVQGAKASDEIISTIKKAEQRNECDVLLLTRGGGSLEDLWCFNNEELAQTIFDCHLPIVAAIGHEVDTTIAELVADLRAPTPSAAAEQLVPDQQALQQKLDYLSITLNDIMFANIEELQSRLDFASVQLSDPENAILVSQHKLESLRQKLFLNIEKKLQTTEYCLEKIDNKLQLNNPLQQLKNNQEKLKTLSLQLNNTWQNIINQHQQRLQIIANGLNNLSPLSTLGRGYSIVRDSNNKQVISSVKKLKSQQQVSLVLVDGEAECKVKNIKTNQK